MSVHVVALTRSGGWGIRCWTCGHSQQVKGWLKVEAQQAAEQHRSTSDASTHTPEQPPQADHDKETPVSADTPTADSLVRRTVAEGIVDAYQAEVTKDIPSPAPTFGAMADAVLAALTREGFTILSPSDLSWGTCPATGEPHTVSLSLCSGCLEYDPE